VWCMCLGWMFFNTVFYGLLTWMPTYLFKVHGLDIKQLGGALFIMFFAGFVGELVGGQIGDIWRARGGQPNTIFRTLFGIAAIVATISVFSVAYVTNAVTVVALLSSTLFFLRWCGMYWAIPSILATRSRAGFLGGCMNLGGNIAGVSVPIIVGLIVQYTGSYFLALMFFAAAGIALLICSLLIDYSRKLPV
jgi:ACS family D-galactonate transporter-like MFS transporter